MKKIIVSLLLLIIIVVTYVVLIKQKPPIETGRIVPSDNGKGIAIEIGNIGLRDIHLKKISINNEEVPKKTKIQAGSGFQEYDSSDVFDFEKNNTKVQSMVLKPNISPKNLIKKQNQGTASAKDKVYELSMLHNKKINRITIKYRYLGVTFEQVIRLAMH
ncbi:hypothetical protein ACFVRR_09310 [Gottfriedia sp. NPDC057948]|uniref:hypothetical protein n=1 Tax=Gottfriedia sp. NPDC057948 TaxID=3346287 RepID=UPI0036DF784D